jgi:hypothetical protein
VRDISELIANKDIATKVRGIGKEIANVTSHGLVQGWEDGDDICPPWRWPFPPGPWPQWQDIIITEGPQPEPWGPRPEPWVSESIQQIVLGNLLVSLAEVTSHLEQGRQLRDIAAITIREAAGNLAKDFGERGNFAS